ncbi:MAG: 50S ribosomal protein L25 [bacterium]
MLKLSASLRQDIGRKNNALRKKGLVPAVLYGHKVDNILLSINAIKLGKVYDQAGENTLIDIKIDDKENRVALINDIVKDSISGDFIHVDFYQVKMDETISAEVPLIFVGNSLAVEQEGGLLIKSLQHLEIEALPMDLPHEITINISKLVTFDDKISIRDISLPEKVKVLANEEDVIVSVVPPRSAEELEELNQTPTETVDDIKTEKEEKAEAKEAEAKEE